MTGEGVSFTIDEDLLRGWESSAALRERAVGFAERCVQRAGPAPPEFDVDVSPRFLLCHTLAHLLIRALDVEAGYPAASLEERIYCADGKEPMAGVLVYVSVADEEGHGPDLLNQADRHACALLLEPSCPYGNVLLDRVFVGGAALGIAAITDHAEAEAVVVAEAAG